MEQPWPGIGGAHLPGTPFAAAPVRAFAQAAAESTNPAFLYRDNR